MYQTNHVPALNMETSTTGCCPQFDASAWDGQTFVFEDKLFVKAVTRSFMHVPINLGSVITKTWKAIEDAGAKDEDEFIMLSLDVSPWKTEQYFWVAKEVPGLENVKLSGTFEAKVFEGPYRDAKKWYDTMVELVKSKGKEQKRIFFYYTTCPKCAKTYGKNYVVGLAEV